MNAERRAWSFERWEEYSRMTPEEELEREIVTTRAIDLNHDVPDINPDNVVAPNLDTITIFAILWFQRRRFAYHLVLIHPGLVDWDKIHCKATGLLNMSPSQVYCTVAGLVCDSGNPWIFVHCDPCAVAKVVDDTQTMTGAECYVVSVCQYWASSQMRQFFRVWDALPMPLVDKMAVRATEHRNASVQSEILAHLRWRRRGIDQQCAVMWLGGDAKGSKNAVHVLWQGQALGEVIAKRMQYSYAEYTDDELFDKKKKMKMDI
jgi:hypothetical protein